MLVGLDWAKPMMFFLLHITCSCIFHAYIPSFISILILICVGAFLLFFFSLSFFRLVALWHQNENLLHPKTLFILGHLLHLPLLILLHLMFCFMMIKLERTFQRTFHDVAFIQNAKSFYQTIPILTFPLSSTIRIRSHCVASRSLVFL